MLNFVSMANKTVEDYDTLLAQNEHQIAAYRGIEDRLAECSRWVAMLGAYGAPITKLDAQIAGALSICGNYIVKRLERRDALQADKERLLTTPSSFY